MKLVMMFYLFMLLMLKSKVFILLTFKHSRQIVMGHGLKPMAGLWEILWCINIFSMKLNSHFTMVLKLLMGRYVSTSWGLLIGSSIGTICFVSFRIGLP